MQEVVRHPHAGYLSLVCVLARLLGGSLALRFQRR